MSGVSINHALVVGHEHNGAWVAGERCENLITTCRVEVIRWLIEQEDVRAADNKGCERGARFAHHLTGVLNKLVNDHRKTGMNRAGHVPAAR